MSMPEGQQDYINQEPIRKVERWNDPWKWLPVVFVSSTILSLWIMYVSVHCVPLITQPDEPSDHLDEDMKTRGTVEICVFHFITILLVICYVRSILAHPGKVPETPEWQFVSPSDQANYQQMETKKSGDRRFCKWCQMYKPDRCHHCRVCRICILKMDHHCPWIYNCVGFKNYKYFFLLLMYSVLDTQLIFWTMTESVHRCVVVDSTPFFTMFLVFFATTLTFFLGTLVTAFWGFHIYLMAKAMTTIEFCEKSLPRQKAKDEKASYYETSVYDLGFFGNVRAVLGDNIMLWFLPLSPPSGDGLSYVTDASRLNTSLEAGRQIRRRSKVQRSTSRIGMGPIGDDFDNGSWSRSQSLIP